MQHVVARVGFPLGTGAVLFFARWRAALTTQVADLVWRKGNQRMRWDVQHATEKPLSGERMMCFSDAEREKKIVRLAVVLQQKKSHSFFFVSFDQLSEANHETRRQSIQRKMRSAGSALHARVQ